MVRTEHRAGEYFGFRAEMVGTRLEALISAWHPLGTRLAPAWQVPSPRARVVDNYQYYNSTISKKSLSRGFLGSRILSSFLEQDPGVSTGKSVWGIRR